MNHSRTMVTKRYLLSVLLACAFLMLMVMALKGFLKDEPIIWAFFLTIGVGAYFLLDLNEAVLRRAVVTEIVVDTNTWWLRPVCWAVAFAVCFCAAASRL